MNVYFRRYQLTPLRSANRLSSTRVKTGVHLMVKMRFTHHFADYFPHEELGDMPVELFLEKFKYQDHEYEQKIFYFLQQDERLRSQKPKSFQNHQLWDGQSAIESLVVKYKMKGPDDLTFIKVLEKNVRVRLDANGLFDRSSFEHFQNDIPRTLLPLIDYLEDPTQDLDWKGSKIPLAQDFIPGSPYEVLIHKPNSRFLKKTDKKVIFSSYMGSDLGQWHCYCELLEKADLAEFHGILTPGLYQEQRLDVMDLKSVKDLYLGLHDGEWKLLCSI